MFGHAAPDTARCSYLDLGCGSGENVLAVAESLPGGRCAGWDPDPVAGAHREALSQAAGLTLGTDAGQFDYVACLGVLSWITAADELLERIAASLAPGGVAIISYHAKPGFHLRAPARDVGGRAGRDVAGARARLRLAAELHGASDAWAAVLLAEEAAWGVREEPEILGDNLAEICEPFSVTEFARAAARHGMAYLGEGLPQDWWAFRLDERSAQRLCAAAGPAALARQQLSDDAAGAAFKASLLVRQQDTPAASRPLESAAELWCRRATAASDGPLGPGFQRVAELSEGWGLDSEEGARAVLRLAAQNRADLRAAPAPVRLQPDERPRAPSLARSQPGPAIATLHHESAELSDPPALRLLGLLDGTRTVDELAAAVPELPDIRYALRELGRVGLLAA